MSNSILCTRHFNTTNMMCETGYSYIDNIYTYKRERTHIYIYKPCLGKYAKTQSRRNTIYKTTQFLHVIHSTISSVFTNVHWSSNKTKGKICLVTKKYQLSIGIYKFCLVQPWPTTSSAMHYGYWWGVFSNLQRGPTWVKGRLGCYFLRNALWAL